MFDKIKERRILLGITQEDLADISQIALRSIKQIESGKGNPSIKTLTKIASALGMVVELKVKKAEDL